MAKTAGFCFGTDRAVKIVNDLISQGKKVCTLGEIIHNEKVVSDFNKAGVRVVDSPLEVKDDEVMVIRSHGVGEDVYNLLKENNISFVDATCPYVAKIHNIVKKESEKGNIVLIAGNPVHPEVLGIIGHTHGESYVFSDETSLLNLLNNCENLLNSPISIVSQTTFNTKSWKKCIFSAKKLCTNLTIFDTICKATAERQEEAERISQQVDVMIVIGGKHSSNSAKLFEVCNEKCNSVFVQDISELDVSDFVNAKTIGITAGASTPASIIKEVLVTMSENVNPMAENQVEEMVDEVVAEKKSFEEMTFEEALEESLNSLNSDQNVKGTVLAVGPTEVQVDIGRKHAGYIPVDELSNTPNVNPEDICKVGDVLDLIVMKTNDAEGTVMLSKKRFDAKRGWNDIVEAEKSKEILEGIVTDVIRGGVLVACSNGVKVFVPASQATLTRTESLDELKGQTVNFKIIDIDQRRKRAVASVRAVLREQRKAETSEFWEKVAVGDKYTGTVKSLTSFGAFVNIGGVDGLVHISELSWQRIKNASEVVSVGDEIEVYVKAIDADKKKISLGYKKAEDNPWTKFITNYNVDDVIKVSVVNLVSYGAFVRIIPGVDGLIHISQIADKRINTPNEVLKVGDEVEAKITEINLESKRVSLSIRALIEPAAEAEEVVADEASVEESVVEE